MARENSILYRTGQIWKVRFMNLGVVIAGVLIFEPQWFRDALPGITPVTLGTVVALSVWYFQCVPLNVLIAGQGGTGYGLARRLELICSTRLHVRLVAHRLQSPTGVRFRELVMADTGTERNNALREAGI